MRKPHPDTGFIPVDRPAGAVDLEDVAQADYALERALDYGDYDPLLVRLRAGKAFPIEQALMADIYERRVKRPSHAPKRHPESLRLRDLHLAVCVADYRLKGATLKAAVRDTATEAGIGLSTVYGAVKQHPNLFLGLSK